MEFSEVRILEDIKSAEEIMKIKMTKIGNKVSFELPIKNKIYNKTLKFNLFYNNTYPFETPILKILTPIFHPNVLGEDICLDILRLNWMPSYSITSIIVSLLMIFEDPDPENSLNNEAADLLKYDLDEFYKRAKS